MSDTPSTDATADNAAEASPKATPKRPSRSRGSLNFSMIVQIVALAIIVIGVNLISCQEYARKDMTLDANYELSDMTARLLDSDLLTERTKPVKIIIAHRRSSSFFTRLATLAEEYRRLGGGNIEVELIDPQRNPDRALEIAAQYRRQFDDDIVIVDARDGDQPIFEGIAAPPEAGIATPQLMLSAHVRFLESEDLALFQSTVATGREILAWQDEDAISSAILSAAEGDFRRFYLVADKSDIVNVTDAGPWQTLTRLFYNQNIALLPIRISEIERIPADADGVAIVAPRFDFDDREIAVLRQYWAQPRSAITVMLSPEHRPDNLRTFLREYGVTPRQDRVITMRRGRPVSAVRGTFTAGPELNKVLSGKSSEFAGASSSLEIRENAPDLVSRRIAPIALFQAADSYWGEVDFAGETPTFDPERDNAAPIYTAAAIIRGNENDDALSAETSRMVVINNTDFLDPELLREENIDFIRSATQWLIGREEMMGVGPKNITTRRISLLPSQTNFINRVTLFFMPILTLVIGAFVWNTRRR